MAWNALWTILSVMLVFLALGVPISYSIGISSLAAILATVSADAAVVTAAQRIFVGMSRFSLTAIPFFILAGNLMNQGGIAGRLVDLVLAVLGRLPGSLLVANVGANALFGAISGSASAAAAAVGSMVRDGEEEQGYDPALCAASNGASAPSGLLIPPSNALITYSLAAGGVSVSALFLAGYVPGILWAACCIAVAVAAAGRKGYRGAAGKYDWKNLGRAALRAIPSLTLIVVVIGGIIAFDLVPDSKKYMLNRFIVLFDHSYDVQHTGWQQTRSLLTIGGGGFWGQGYLHGTQSQAGVGSVPARHTDLIFAVIGEELGFVGATLAILLLVAIIIRVLVVGRRAAQPFHTYVCVGIASMVMFQMIINIGMCLFVMPVIGLTLPFISYGGTSIVTLFAAMGMVSGIQKRARPEWLR